MLTKKDCYVTIKYYLNIIGWVTIKCKPIIRWYIKYNKIKPTNVISIFTISLLKLINFIIYLFVKYLNNLSL